MFGLILVMVSFELLYQVIFLGFFLFEIVICFISDILSW